MHKKLSILFTVYMGKKPIDTRHEIFCFSFIVVNGILKYKSVIVLTDCLFMLSAEILEENMFFCEKLLYKHLYIKIVGKLIHD